MKESKNNMELNRNILNVFAGDTKKYVSPLVNQRLGFKVIRKSITQ